MDKYSKTEAGKRFKHFADRYYKGKKKELAKLLGLANPNQLADYFNGKAILGNEKLSIVSKLGFNIKYYLYEDGDMTNPAIVKENVVEYAAHRTEEVKELQEEIKKLKAIIFDLREELDILRQQQNK